MKVRGNNEMISVEKIDEQFVICSDDEKQMRQEIEEVIEKYRI